MKIFGCLIATVLFMLLIPSCDLIDNIKADISTAKGQVASLNIGVAQGIYTKCIDFWHDKYSLEVLIQPISAEANKIYIVSLYEKGQLRQKNTISWTQPEINIKATKFVSYNISYEEYRVYSKEHDITIVFGKKPKSLSNIFSISIASEPVLSDFSIRSFNIEPKQASINQPIYISLWIINNTKSDHNIELEINGKIEQTVLMGSCPTKYNPFGCNVKFTVTKPKPGIYNVVIGQLKDSFTIR